MLLLHPIAQAAYNSINDARTALAAFFGATPSPAALAAQLVTDSASLTPPGTVTAILSGLSTQATTLNGAQFNPTPVGSDGAVLKAFVIAAKSDIAAVQTGTWASMASARATYFATQTGANYDALKTAADAYRASAATTTMRNKLAEQASAPCAASDYAAAAPAIGAAASAAYTSFPAVVTATSNAISALPSLTSYSTAINQVTLPPLTVGTSARTAVQLGYNGRTTHLGGERVSTTAATWVTQAPAVNHYFCHTACLHAPQQTSSKMYALCKPTTPTQSLSCARFLTLRKRRLTAFRRR